MTRAFIGADGRVAGTGVEDLVDGDASIWRVWDLVDRLDLSLFERAFRADGSGGRPYDPRLVVTAVVSCYLRGVRSPSRIAADCRDRVELVVVLGGRTPSEATIRRWISRHPGAWQGVQSEVLAACAGEGLVEVAVTATDGSPVAASAALSANRSLAWLDRRITGLQQDLTDLAGQHEQATDGLPAPGGVSAFIAQVCDIGRHREQHLRDRLAQLHAARAVAVTRGRELAGEPDRLHRLQDRVDRHMTTLTAMITAQRAKLAARAARDARGERVPGPRPTPVEHDRHIHQQWQALNTARAKLDQALQAQHLP
jgi:transposase